MNPPVPEADPRPAAPQLRGAVVTEEPLSVDEAIRATSTRRTGGLALFVGLVREVDGDDDVTSLDYSAHPSATDELRAIADRVLQGSGVETAFVAHRVGHLEVGDLAVVVSVGAVHRQQALATCHALIDEVKRSTPIWKQQHTVDGSSHWVGL